VELSIQACDGAGEEEEKKQAKPNFGRSSQFRIEEEGKINK
jgi:hypothetical protein